MQPAEPIESLPFPLSQNAFCRYEPIEKRIKSIRALIIDDLLRDERDLSDVARSEWGKSATVQLKRERQISGMALENIINNVQRLVQEPVTEVAHVSELATATREFKPQAIILSGTLRDFDYYDPKILSDFTNFIRETRVPVLAICGGHQLVGLSYGARVVTLANLEQDQQRENRPVEYQYRFVRIIAPDDPIFENLKDGADGTWQDRTQRTHLLRVWQNHGLQLDRVPDGFELLATSYLCRNQMMVRRVEGQLIYTVQFHLEKSFEDWNKSRTRWEHPNESRHGRILFENFLRLALEHVSKSQ
jgi:GMP synthase (glutamine-hydrolysing)